MPKRVYLQPREIAKKSAFHTAYVGDGAVSDDGQPLKFYALTFVQGVAKNVDETMYARFKNAGVCDTNRPSFDDDTE